MDILLGLIFCIIIYIVFPQKLNLIAVVLSSTVMSVMAFYLSDSNQYDLIFHRNLLDDLINGGFETAVIYSSVDKSPLYIWFEYFLSLFKENRLASAIPTFIGYFSLGFVLYKMNKDVRIKLKLVLIYSSLIFILPWQDYSAGVRGAFAYSIFLLAVYADMLKNNRITALMLYLCSIYIHQAALVLCLLRMLLLLHQKSFLNYRLVCLICLGLGSMTFVLGPILHSIAQATDINIFKTISDSFNGYVIKGTKLYEYSVVGLRLFAILLIYYITRKSLLKDEREQSQPFKLYTLIMLTTIGYIWQYDIVCRYSFVCVVLSALLLCRCRIQYIYLLFIFSLINVLIYNNIYYLTWEILI